MCVCYVSGKDSLEWYVSNFLKASQQISSDIDSGGFSSKIVGLYHSCSFVI